MAINVSRRKFLKGATCSTCAAAASGMLPGFLDRLAYGDPGNGKKALVIVQRGGWDSLAVAPEDNATLAGIRPTLHRPANEVLPLGSSNMALHQALPTLQARFNLGELAAIRQVGYINMTGSHDEAMDYYALAGGPSRTANMTSVGWLARLGATNNFDSPYNVFDLTGGDTSTQGGSYKAFSADNLSTFGFAAEAAAEENFRLDTAFGIIRDGLRPNGLMAETGTNWSGVENSYAAIEAAIQNGPAGPVQYPAGNAYANKLRDADIVFANFPQVRTVVIDHGGYDTHGGQAAGLNRLLGNLDAALNAFIANMIAQGLWGNIIVIILSEFSRTIAENGNFGTDHGGAQTMFVMGPSVNGGVYGSDLNLTPQVLSRNSLPMQFNVVNDVYAPIVRGMGFNADSVFSGLSGSGLNLIKP